MRTFPRLRPAFGRDAAHAQVAELVDALVSGTSGAIRGGSSPLLGTTETSGRAQQQSLNNKAIRYAGGSSRQTSDKEPCMSLRAKSITQTSDGQRTLIVISSVRFKRAQSTRSTHTKGVIKLTLDNAPQQPAARKRAKDAA